jgi:uncharacterized protein DUF885
MRGYFKLASLLFARSGRDARAPSIGGVRSACCLLYALSRLPHFHTIITQELKEASVDTMRITTGLSMALLILMMVWPALIASAQTDEASAKALRELFKGEWDYQMEQNPTTASSLGDRRWNDRWEDASLAATEQRQQHRQEVLARLKKIDRQRLSSADQLNYDLFQKEYELDIEEHKYRTYLLPLNQGLDRAPELASKADGPEHRPDAGRRKGAHDVAESSVGPAPRTD